MVLLRSEEDVELLHKVENIVAVITWYDAPAHLREEYKSISYNRRRFVYRLVCTNGKEKETVNKNIDKSRHI